MFPTARRSPRRWRHPGQERADTRKGTQAHRAVQAAGIGGDGEGDRGLNQPMLLRLTRDTDPCKGLFQHHPPADLEALVREPGVLHNMELSPPDTGRCVCERAGDQGRLGRRG